ncbi:hypothetical protein HOC01_05445 [archaeon]|nr:hypothetical protein [archaeon]MBT6697716.1 hypothetical protein [archaeon]
MKKIASKTKQIFTNFRVILLIVFVLFALTSIFTINPTNWFADGVTIQSVEADSLAQQAGILSPDGGTTPMQKERILEIDGTKITSIEQFYELTTNIQEQTAVRITSTSANYLILTPLLNESNSNESNTQLTQIDLGINVVEPAKNNLRKGLDLAGGTRVLLTPTERVSDETLEVTAESLYERLNVYGLSDISITPASDLAGDQYIIIEIAGATQTEVEELLSKQGKFEAQIANQTVFSSANDDINYVCRSADCSGIDPQRGCQANQEGAYACSFFFSISLSAEAAQKQADVTQTLDVEYSGTSRYLSEDLILYLDDEEVDSLRIGAELQGRAITDISISGSGAGISQEAAIEDTLNNMRRLQTILITGSLPVELEIVKIDTISPALGEEFLSNLTLVAIIAILAVFTTIMVRYRKPKIAIPMSIIMLSEIILILGFAALVGWNLDLAALAGIIIAAGTGVDHLIIISDETLRGEKQATKLKAKVKAAMGIVMGAYFTTVVGMMPLWFAGAGLLKGFAFTTIIGITLGVFIARPAYANIVKILLEQDE